MFSEIGATGADLEVFFKKLAKIQDDFVNGKTTINTVVAAAVKFDQLALAMERARETILATCELSAWVVEALVSPARFHPLRLAARQTVEQRFSLAAGESAYRALLTARPMR